MLSPQLVEDVVYFNVELSLLISCVIKSKVVNAILIGRPALNTFLHAAFITYEVEAVEGSTEFILVIVYAKGCFVLRCIALSKAVLLIIEQMCPAKLNRYSITQTSIVLCVPAAGNTAYAVLILAIVRIVLVGGAVHSHANTGLGFEPAQHHVIIRCKFVVVTDRRCTAFGSTQVCITVFMVVQLCQARQNVVIAAARIQGILFGNIPAQFVADGVMAFIAVRSVVTNTAG